ncbi:MAG: helix-turn-helix domain-containing protein [Pseudohongiellaceae bacterium]
MSRGAQSQPAIPQFALYGENTPSHELEFVHIEDIHERSARNGWLIKPHRHTQLFQVLVMWSGAVKIRIDGDSHDSAGAVAVILPVGVVHGFEFSPDTQGSVLSLAVNQQALDPGNQLQRLLNDSLSRPAVLALKGRDNVVEPLRRQLDQLAQELQRPQPEQRTALFALALLVLISVSRLAALQQQDEQVRRPGVLLTDRFRALVEEHFKEHWSVARFAETLYVSLSTLNRACSEVLGQSAKQLLTDRLHVEAKRRLTYTGETLDQIAWDLGYKDAAYFSRVFKQQEGCSPKAFRRGR